MLLFFHDVTSHSRSAIERASQIMQFAYRAKSDWLRIALACLTHTKNHSLAKFEFYFFDGLCPE